MRRQEQRRRSRRRLTLITVVALGVLAIAGGVGAVIANQPERSSLDAVTSYQYAGSQHTNDPVTYAELPPVGGPHRYAWLNCGIYDKPVPNENAVHSLEHGAVWITYRPDLPTQQIKRLKDRAADDPYVLLSPYPDLPSPVVASAWNRQLQLTGPDDERLPAFLQAFVGGSQAPEPGALCNSGVGTPTG